MQIESNKSLLKLNTFGFKQNAEFFCEPTTEDELREAIDFAKSRRLPVSVLGGGSNIILTGDVAGLTIKLAGDNVNFVNQNDHTIVTAGAGTPWHQLVLKCIEQGLYGIENLSLIPGNSGAAPIQNIGAYGVELSDVLTQVTAIDLESIQEHVFANNDCQFAYRDSVFKQSLSGKVIITQITLRLSRTNQVKTSYAALSTELERRGIDQPDARAVSDAVIAIRQSKLPDPAIIGNAGSFFKNPVIPESHLTQLQSQWPDIPAHSSSAEHFKVPAAWLIEQAGWKGKRSGAIASHQQQPLVLVHHGGASAEDLLQFASEIRASVKDRFNISLEREPVLFGRG